MKKLIALCISGLLLSSLSSPVQASDSGVGTVGEIIITQGGIVLFTHSGTRTAAPSCQAANIPQRWAFNSTTPAGQARLAALLTLKSAGKPFWLTGTAACSDWGDTESVSYFIIL